MAERKVLNKYYSPDFDPAKIPRKHIPKNHQIQIRFMLPMRIKCSSCGTYLHEGTKFNSRKEQVVGESYKQIKIFRFYFKCTTCSTEITVKTDPENSDYVVESGAVRCFQVLRTDDVKGLKSFEFEDQVLGELKCMKTRRASVTTDAMLKALKKVEEEDEAVVKAVFGRTKGLVRRVADDSFLSKRRKVDDKVVTDCSSRRGFVLKSSTVRLVVVKNVSMVKLCEDYDSD